MPKLRFEGRSFKKMNHGIWVKNHRDFQLFISNKLISNLKEERPVKGCDGVIEFEVPDWLIKKNEVLCGYCA